MKLDYMNAEQWLCLIMQQKMLFGYLAVRHPAIEKYFYDDDSKELRIELENGNSFFEKICIEDMFGFSPIGNLRGVKECMQRLDEKQKEEFINSPLYQIV